MSQVIATFGFGPFDMNWLSTALVLTTPLLFPAVGELISERAGVLNVGLEGMMLSGAFFSYMVTAKTGSIPAGAFAGIGGGLFFGVIMALLSIEAKADQIVAGVGINLAGVGLTSYLFDQMYSSGTQIVVPTVTPLRIPGLADIPHFGPAIFDQDPLLYIAFLLVPVSWFLLKRTRWGLAVRASGELPAAADTAGISVRRVRWFSVLLASALAGVGGSYLVIVDVGIFHQQMTNGRGFLALVAVIFGRWSPWGVLGACFALGGTDALQLRLADQSSVPHQVWVILGIIAVAVVLYRAVVRRRIARPLDAAILVAVAVFGFVTFAVNPPWDLPQQFWQALPYLVALAVLGGALTRAHMPAKLTLPYRRGEG